MELYNRRQVLNRGLCRLGRCRSSSNTARRVCQRSGGRPRQRQQDRQGQCLQDGAGVASLDGTAEPVVAYIHDASSGEISLFVGSREVTLHDTAIVAKLASAARKGA